MKAKTNFIVLGVIVGLSILFLVSFHYFRDAAVDNLLSFGLIGVFSLTFVMDFIIQPFSPDIIVFGSSIGTANTGLGSVTSIALTAGIASVFAGYVDHKIGEKIGTDGFIKIFGKKHIEKGQLFFEKWGSLAVVVGALAPIPYSAICWLSGIYKMNIHYFILFSLIARIPRFFLFAYFGGLL